MKQRENKRFLASLILILCTANMYARDFGQALQMDGLDDLVFVGNDTMLQVNHFTLTAWVHPYSYSGPLPNEQRMEVLEKAGEYWMNISTTEKGNRDTIGEIRVGGKFGDEAKWYYLDSNYIVPLNTWTHIACTYDGDSLRLFVNGDPETAMEIAEDFTARFQDENMLGLGCKCKVHPDSLVEAQFHGMLDDISIWDTPLSVEEIRDLMYNAITPAHPKWDLLAALYEFEEDESQQSFGSIVDSKNSVNGMNYGSVWVTSTLTAVQNQPVLIAGHFKLQANFPNPFNPSTTIQFTLPHTTQVDLSVYDLTGRHIETLADGLMQAGTHSIQWNANGLPSGVYFYTLQTPGFSQTQRCTLLE